MARRAGRLPRNRLALANGWRLTWGCWRRVRISHFQQNRADDIMALKRRQLLRHKAVRSLKIVKRKMSDHQRVVERLRGLSDEALAARWHDILHHVRNELTYLNRERQMMEYVAGEVLNKNPRFMEHRGRQFFERVRSWYAIAMAIAYRRQADRDPRSASLRVVLEEMRVRPGVYTVKTIRPFVGPLATDDTIRDEVMAPVLDENGLLSKSILDKDIDSLIHVGAKVRHFVNKFVAHTDHQTRRDGGLTLTFAQIYAAHAECEKIAGRWLAALGGYRYGIKPVEEFDWVDVFDFPWRLHRATDHPDTRRYIVTVDSVLDSEEEVDSLFEGASPEDRARHRQTAISEVLQKAAQLAPDDKFTAELVLPSMVAVERLL